MQIARRLRDIDRINTHLALGKKRSHRKFRTRVKFFVNLPELRSKRYPKTFGRLSVFENFCAVENLCKVYGKSLLLLPLPLPLPPKIISNSHTPEIKKENPKTKKKEGNKPKEQFTTW